jgi:chromosome segregation ATPase
MIWFKVKGGQMKNYKAILAAFLIGVTIFAVFKYIMTLKERNDLQSTLGQVQGQLTVLQYQNRKLFQTIEKEKQLQQGLVQENTGLKENLRVAEEKLMKIDADLSLAKKAVEQLNIEAGTLKEENTALKGRLGSIKELKKAIREVKIQMHEVKVQVRKKFDADKLLEGNRGFVLREGKSTYPAKVKIEVNPAQ